MSDSIISSAFARSFLLASAAAIVSVSAAGANQPASAAASRHRRRPATKARAAARPPQRSGARAARVSRVSNPAVAPGRERSGEGTRADGPHRAAGAARHSADAGRRRHRAGRGLPEFDRRQHHQGRARLRAGRVRAAEMGRRHAAVDPRLRPVAQLPSARRAALHGRHSDQHRRRLRRFPGNRSDRLQICRGLQGRQCAAIRRQLARRRHQFRDADRPRSVSERGVGSTSAPSGSGGCRPTPAAPTARGTASSPPRRRPPTASAITATAQPRASAAMSAISSRPMSRRGSTSTPTRCGSASPAPSPRLRR